MRVKFEKIHKQKMKEWKKVLVEQGLGMKRKEKIEPKETEPNS